MLFLSRQTGIECGDTEATPTGETVDERSFEGRPNSTRFCQQPGAVENSRLARTKAVTRVGPVEIESPDR